MWLSTLGMITSGLALQNHEVWSVTSQNLNQNQNLSKSVHYPWKRTHPTAPLTKIGTSKIWNVRYYYKNQDTFATDKVACNSVNISQSDRSMKFQIFTSRGIRHIGKGQPSFSIAKTKGSFVLYTEYFVYGQPYLFLECPPANCIDYLYIFRVWRSPFQLAPLYSFQLTPRGANIWGKLKCFKYFGKSNLWPGFSITSLLLDFICFASAQNRIKYGIFNFLEQIQAPCKKCKLQIQTWQKLTKLRNTLRFL